MSEVSNSCLIEHDLVIDDESLLARVYAIKELDFESLRGLA